MRRYVNVRKEKAHVSRAPSRVGLKGAIDMEQHKLTQKEMGHGLAGRW